MRPESSKNVVKVLPSGMKLNKAIANQGREIIKILGAQAAMQLDLSTQVPASQIFPTTGTSHAIALGKAKIFLRYQSLASLTWPARSPDRTAIPTSFTATIHQYQETFKFTSR